MGGVRGGGRAQGSLLCPPCTPTPTMTDEAEIVCAEAILHRGQVERAVRQEVVAGPPAGERE